MYYQFMDQSITSEEPVILEETIEDEKLADWWQRVLALIIDNIIIFAIAIIPLLIIVGIIYGGVNNFESTQSESDALSAALAFLMLAFLASIFFWIVSSFYFGFTMMRKGKRNGQSWGKQILNITVVRKNGQQIGFGFSFVRQILVIQILFATFAQILFAIVFNFWPVIASLPLPLIIDYLWPLWDDKNQALHDKIVSARVIKGESTRI